MTLSEAIDQLEAQWSDEQGFLFQIRMGRFDLAKAEDLVLTIEQIEATDASSVPRRAVSLLWYLPLFLGWQRERIDPKYWGELDRVITSVTNQLERILGVP